MIEVRNISKSFGEHLVLKHVSFSFEQGKTNLIIGASGSGKTVLVKCMVGLHELDQGAVIYDGRVFNEMSFREKKSVRKELGMLFQGSALFDSMSVEDNIMFPLKMFTGMKPAEMRERASFCLERVNLAGKNKLFPSELSGGMMKRVGIARAIAMNPRYLFCDEPNSGLDPQTAILIDDLIREITVEYNMTTIVVTHDMNSVMNIGDKIAFIFSGQVWWEGTNKEILETENKELVDFVYASEFLRALRQR